MKILVPVKQVPALDEDVEIDGARLAAEELEWDLNEWDSFSVEAALRLAEAEEGSEVVVVTVGGEESEDGLLSCLANGADRAVRVEAEDLGEAVGDPIAIAHVLAAVARRESPDLLLCGVQSSDAAHSATGVALAGLLDLAHVAVVSRIERQDAELIVDRELEGGVVETLRLRTPALLTIQTGINEPRYANLRAIKQARAKPLETLSLAEVGLSREEMQAASGARPISLAPRQSGGAASMLEGAPSEIAAQILEIVREAVTA